MTTVRTETNPPIAFEVTGDGPTLVLVHGITESRHTWDPLIADLAADHRVVALDLRGHGESGGGDGYDPMSMAADVAAVLAAAGATDPLLVGHSLGGVVVSAYAALLPSRGVVNIDQPLRLAAFKESLSQIEPMLRSDAATFRAVIAAMFEQMSGPLAAEERARINASSDPKQAVVLGVWSTVFSSTVEALDATISSLSSAIKVPYLSLHGIDPGSEYAPWLTGLVPTAAVEVWPGQGHYPHLVDPNRFLARLRAFEATLTA